MKDEIPEAAKGLCWGGFFLNWIWAIGNSTWIGLLTLVPGLNLIMPFVLLFKGREWAWKNGEWKSVEHFNSVQRVWSTCGLLLCLFIPAIGILAAIAIPNFVRFQAKARQSEAKIALTSLYSNEQLVFAETGSFTTDINKLNALDTKLYQVGFADTGAEYKMYCRECTADKTTFKAVAFGRVSPERTMDVWTIDQDRHLVHVQEGL